MENTACVMGNAHKHKVETINKKKNKVKGKAFKVLGLSKKMFLGLSNERKVHHALQK
jgi:hypothetical protein